VDLDIAEREIAQTYVLRILAGQGLLERLAFKGGTAICKIYLGNQGRFSLDLDFTTTRDTGPEALILDVAGLFHNQTHHGLAFTIPTGDYYANLESCGAEIGYRHEWFESGKFVIQINFRSAPLLPVRPATLHKERYFEWLGIEPPAVPSLALDEIVGEKIRAAFQRSQVRDLYDLYLLAGYRFDRNRVWRIAVLKCWETNLHSIRQPSSPGLRPGNSNGLTCAGCAQGAGNPAGCDHPRRVGELRFPHRTWPGGSTACL